MDPMPPRLTEVGDHERPDHYHLPAGAKCFFWGEYTPYEHTNGKKWNFSATNRLMSNFKKKLERKGQPDWPYKNQALQQIAQAFSKFWKWDDLHRQHRVALVPIPPSKARTATAFDPRMYDMLNALAGKVGIQLDIRDCLSFSGKYAASHESDDRPTPDELYAELGFDNTAGRPKNQPGVIFLFDDMLTTGAHYVAVTRMLGVHFPGVPVVGNFVSRRIVPNPFADLSDFEDL
jgi:predicted amidophosphoribosyltransferase